MGSATVINNFVHVFVSALTASKQDLHFKNRCFSFQSTCTFTRTIQGSVLFFSASSDSCHQPFLCFGTRVICALTVTLADDLPNLAVAIKQDLNSPSSALTSSKKISFPHLR